MFDRSVVGEEFGMEPQDLFQRNPQAEACNSGTLIQWQPSVERKEHCTFRQFGASKTTQCDEKERMREDGKRTCRGTPAICCFVLSRRRFDMSFPYEGYLQKGMFL